MKKLFLLSLFTITLFGVKEEVPSGLINISEDGRLWCVGSKGHWYFLNLQNKQWVKAAAKPEGTVRFLSYTDENGRTAFVEVSDLNQENFIQIIPKESSEFYSKSNESIYDNGEISNDENKNEIQQPQTLFSEEMSPAVIGSVSALAITAIIATISYFGIDLAYKMAIGTQPPTGMSYFQKVKAILGVKATEKAQESLQDDA